MTQHLATFNKILFAKGGFSDNKCTKITFAFVRALPQTPLGMGYDAPNLIVLWGREYQLHISLPLNAFGISMSNVYQ